MRCNGLCFTDPSLFKRALGVLALVSLYGAFIHSMFCSTSNKIDFIENQDAKKVIFTAFRPGKLKLTFNSPNIISTAVKT